jgi:hypothetical protein
MQIVTQNHSGGDFIERPPRAVIAGSGFSGSAFGKRPFSVPTAQTLIDQFDGNSQIGSQTLAKPRGFLSHFAAGAIET